MAKVCFLFFFFFLFGSIVAQIDYGIRDISIDSIDFESDDFDQSNHSSLESVERSLPQCLTTPDISSTCINARQRIFPSNQVQLSCVYLNSLFYGLTKPINEIHVSASECESSPRSTGNCKRLAPLKNKKDYYFNKKEQSICIEADIDSICKFKTDSCSRWYDIEISTPKCSKNSAIVSILVAKSVRSFVGYPSLKSCRFGFPLSTGITTHAVSTGSVSTGITTGATTGVTTSLTTGIAGHLEVVLVQNLGNIGTMPDYPDMLGSIITPNRDLTVTSLGYYCTPKNSPETVSFQVGIFTSIGDLITSATVNLQQCTSVEYQYVDINAITLTSGVQYVIAAEISGFYHFPFEFNMGVAYSMYSSDVTLNGGRYSGERFFGFPLSEYNVAYPIASFKYY